MFCYNQACCHNTFERLSDAAKTTLDIGSAGLLYGWLWFAEPQIHAPQQQAGQLPQQAGSSSLEGHVPSNESLPLPNQADDEDLAG